MIKKWTIILQWISYSPILILLRRKRECKKFTSTNLLHQKILIWKLFDRCFTMNNTQKTHLLITNYPTQNTSKKNSKTHQADGHTKKHLRQSMWSSVSNNALSHQNYLHRLQVHLLHPILLSPRAEERWPYRYLAQQRSGSDVMDERLQQPDKLWPCLIPSLITSFLTVFSIEYKKRGAGKESVPDVARDGLSKSSEIDSTFYQKCHGVENFYRLASKANTDDLTIRRICSRSNCSFRFIRNPLHSILLVITLHARGYHSCKYLPFTWLRQSRVGAACLLIHLSWTTSSSIWYGSNWICVTREDTLLSRVQKFWIESILVSFSHLFVLQTQSWRKQRKNNLGKSWKHLQ